MNEHHIGQQGGTHPPLCGQVGEHSLSPAPETLRKHLRDRGWLLFAVQGWTTVLSRSAWGALVSEAQPSFSPPGASLKADLSQGTSGVYQEQCGVPQGGETDLEAPGGTTFYLAGLHHTAQGPTPSKRSACWNRQMMVDGTSP